MITLVPAIDIIDGKCVRLSQGDYNSKKVYYDNPLEVARMFEDAGIKRLHLVDLDGAKSRKVVNYKTLSNITSATKLVVDFGGGVTSKDDLKKVFDHGAAMITIGSIAVSNKALVVEWLQSYGPDKIIIGADVKGKNIAIAGWLEETNNEISGFVKFYLEQNAKYFLCTDISKDGMLQGVSIKLYTDLQQQFNEMNLIASGGVTTIKDIEELDALGIHSVIIGKAFYEGLITLKDLIKFI